MRSLLLVGMLIGLVLVAYLQMDGARNTADSLDADSAHDIPRQVENEINAATEQRIQKLKQSAD